MKFNEKLISIRKMRGLSQEELGMELQVSRLSKWENLQKSMPLILIAAIILGFILHLLFPDIQWLWGSTR